LKPASAIPPRGNEKGGVEGEVGRFRRNHLVPVPQFATDADFNDYLEQCCIEDRARRAGEREMTVGEAIDAERPHLLALPETGFPTAEQGFVRVDGKGCVKVRGNWYSVPLAAGIEARYEVSAAMVRVRAEGRRVAEHRRCYENGRQILDLEHYLDVLWRKPGALPGATALAQWRRQGRWPESYDRLWRAFEKRQGKAAGTRALIELLAEGRRVGYERLTVAVEQALELDLSDPAALWQLLGVPAATPPALAEEARWSCYQRPLPSVADEYDLLLPGGGQ
jgi:hypothetical protein